jgi:hypothetical protein
MGKKLDLLEVWAYKSTFKGMDFRCSSSVGAIALLVGSVSCTFLTTAARAGDRIEFSAPAIPLAVPQPAVEIKHPHETIGSAGAAAGLLDDVNMVAPPQVIVSRPKTKEQNPWSLNPLQADDPDQRNADNWFTSQSEPNRLTNGSGLNMQRDADTRDSSSLLQQRYDSAHEAGQNRFDRDQAQTDDPSGRKSSSDPEASLLAKALGRDSSGSYQFSGGRFMPFMDQFRTFTGGAYEQQMNNSTLSANSAYDTTLPADNESYTPQDESRNRQASQQADAADQSYLRAWEPPPDRSSTSRSSSSSTLNQDNPSRVVAPNQPVNLPMPKRPGDPF